MKKLKSFLSNKSNLEDFLGDKEAALQMNQLITDVIGAIEEGFALYDHHDRLVLWNDQLLYMFPSMQKLVDQHPSYTDLMKTCISAGDISMEIDQQDRWLQMRLRQRAKPHSQVEYQLSGGRWIRVTDRRTHNGYVLCICHDITDIKTREEKLRAAKELAETASQTKSNFLAHVSHELRTPLNAIIGFSELMSREFFGPLPNEHYKGYANDIHCSAQHLLGLIDDILDVSKAEGGHAELHEETFSLAEVAMQIERMIELRVKEAKLTLQIKLAPQLPLLYADGRKIKQILINLLVNSIKFTPEGGTILLNVEEAENHDLLIQVQDTGIGMEAKDIPRALEAFGQVENTMTRKYEGSGLGLYLSSLYANLHGGKLRIRSQKGKGTLVNLTLPSERLVMAAA